MCDLDDLRVLSLPQMQQVNAGGQAVELHQEGHPIRPALDGTSLQVNKDPIHLICLWAGDIDANDVVSGVGVGRESL